MNSILTSEGDAEFRAADWQVIKCPVFDFIFQHFLDVCACWISCTKRYFGNCLNIVCDGAVETFDVYFLELKPLVEFSYLSNMNKRKC